jgi:hypothetical protein
VIHNGLSRRRDAVVARDGKEVKRGLSNKKGNQEQTVFKDKEKKGV